MDRCQDLKALLTQPIPVVVIKLLQVLFSGIARRNATSYHHSIAGVLPTCADIHAADDSKCVHSRILEYVAGPGLPLTGHAQAHRRHITNSYETYTIYISSPTYISPKS